MQRFSDELDYKKQLPSKMRRMLLAPKSNVSLDLWVRAPGLQLGRMPHAYKVENVLLQPKMRDMTKRLREKFDVRTMTVIQEGNEPLSSIIQHHLFHDACETISREMQHGVLKGMTLHFGPEPNAPEVTTHAVTTPSFLQMEQGWGALKSYFDDLQRFSCNERHKRMQVKVPEKYVGNVEVERFIAQHALAIRVMNAIKRFMIHSTGNLVGSVERQQMQYLLFSLVFFMPGNHSNSLRPNGMLLWDNVFDVYTQKTGSINAYRLNYDSVKEPNTPQQFAGESLTFYVMVLWIFQAYWKATREMDWIVRKEANLAYKEKNQ